MRKTSLKISALICTAICCAGCADFRAAVTAVGDGLGDKALSGTALIDVWKITPSDPATNSAPTGKKVTVIGSLKSIPMVSHGKAQVKDYAEYRKTRTPAWYNRDNVTEEETLILTGDNAAELRTFLQSRLQQTSSMTNPQ
ncbi:MAG: hypothetical protein MR727_04780 [Lentisphaeria bacterium]|nr:hypothetical protein [Lentisphaeria bacterium]